MAKKFVIFVFTPKKIVFNFASEMFIKTTRVFTYLICVSKRVKVTDLRNFTAYVRGFLLACCCF